MRDPRYDILFEPVKIGPVTAPNRFYQVPHCDGMGYRYPRSEARHRGIKAAGGWGVVCTQEAEIHPTSDITPAHEARIWDDRDIPALKFVTEAVHEHGSLAAIELVHNGFNASNRYSRKVPIGPSAGALMNDDPIQGRGMDKADIKEFRQWHRDAAIRGRDAGFDIIYVYAGHCLTLLQYFLLKRYNQRIDEYGGSFTNRLRLFREVIADTKDAVGDKCGIAVRLAVDELLGKEGLQFETEGIDIISALAEEPDLWDVNISDWSNDSQTSRFSEEGYQEPYTQFVKSLTSKPVVGVGRYTSPDTMVRLVKSGHLDFIGAARPSIADPFLPNKVKEGRPEDIRECIGCNICVSGDMTSAPMRCTQNPSTGEEWRRNWHPEYIDQSKNVEPCLIVGGGVAGLEAARTLIQRDVEVTIAEKSQNWGGRVTRESALFGLNEWRRVRDWRMGQLQQSNKVQMYLDSPLTAEDILQQAIPHVALATGAKWRKDGVGRIHRLPLKFLVPESILSPDDVMDGTAQMKPSSKIVVFDDDRFYLASVLAEQLARDGHQVCYVTPSAVAASWSENTLEQSRIQSRLIALGVQIITLKSLQGMEKDSLSLACIYGGKTINIPCEKLLLVTSRQAEDSLYQELYNRQDEWHDAGIKSITAIGDCYCPTLIAGAVYAGHLYAQNYDKTEAEIILREDMMRNG